MSTGLISALIILFVIITIIQIGKIAEHVGILKGKDEAQRESNQFNGIIMLIVLLVGLPLMIWSAFAYKDTFLAAYEPASAHGGEIDYMFDWSVFWTGIVFVITQILLFYYTFRYSGSKKSQKAKWFPHDTRLEVIWTAVPAIVMTILVVMGIKRWYDITGPAPATGYHTVEVTGKQFDWIIRYPGHDGQLGKKYFEEITSMNHLGQIWADKANMDDFQTNEIHLPVDSPVLFKLGSRDVLHSFYLPHFRVKMDCVPGMPTQFWFTPTITTKEMRERRGDEEFNYELACAELCGKSHFSMRKIVVVETLAEYKEWLAKQESYYEKSIKGTEHAKNKYEYNLEDDVPVKLTAL